MIVCKRASHKLIKKVISHKFEYSILLLLQIYRNVAFALPSQSSFYKKEENFQNSSQTF